MEKKSKVALSILGVSSLTLLTVAAVYSASSFNALNKAKGDNTSQIVTQAMLDATPLSTYDLGGPNGLDSKFTIALPNNKKIDGAILYRDCAQQFVGGYLGDRVGIHNNTDVAQAYNFNFLFSFEDGIQSFNAVYSVETELDSGEASSETFHVQMKCTSEVTDFYKFLEDKCDEGKYNQLTRFIYSSDSASENTYLLLSYFHKEEYYTINSGTNINNQRMEFTYKEYGTKCIAALQFTYRTWDSNYVKPHKWLRFKLNQLEFTYACHR